MYYFIAGLLLWFLRLEPLPLNSLPHPNTHISQQRKSIEALTTGEQSECKYLIICLADGPGLVKAQTAQGLLQTTHHGRWPAK